MNMSTTTTSSKSNLEKIQQNLRLKSENDKISILNKTDNDNNKITSLYNTQSSMGKTILITNNISQKGTTNLSGSDNRNNNSSITILTSRDDNEEELLDVNDKSVQRSTLVVDRINICINNHYNESMPTTTTPTSINVTSKNDDLTSAQLKTKMKAEPNDKKDEPDSTTTTSQIVKESEIYNIGQDVFVQHKDGRWYLGTVVVIARNQCLVKFGDNTERWSSFDELTKLNVCDPNSAPICVVCKKNDNRENVEVCDKCGRGYHEKCVDSSDKKRLWFCRRHHNRVKDSKMYKNDDRKMCSNNNSNRIRNILFNKSQLPYNIDALNWDSYHRVNVEQIYCYCGGNGKWFTQMLQCLRCEQWFHEKCIQGLQFPLYCGDRFYIFVCSMCNYGNEFVRRLELKWEDIVHLLLFNLTIYNSKKYYDLTSVVVPYAVDNWEILQLPTHIKNLSRNQISEHIFETLKSHKTRFKNGKEIKKSNGIWCLRSRVPPPISNISIPQGVKVTENYIGENMPNMKLLNLCSKLPGPYQNDVKIHNVMMGVTYQNDNSDIESLTSSSDTNIDLTYNSDDEIPIKEIEMISEQFKNERHNGDISSSNSSTPLICDPNMNDYDGNDTDHSHEDYFDDLAKDYIDVDDSSKMSFDNDDDEIKNDDEKIDLPQLNQNMYHSHEHIQTINTIEICDTSDDTSRGTLDLIIPPPKNFQGRNNPFHNQNLQTSGTTKLIGGSTNDANIINSQNNISHILSKHSINHIDVKKGKRKQTNSNHNIKLIDSMQVNGNTAGQFRIVKRRLSARDILIGPNQEIKRRKLNRRSGQVEVISTQTIQTLSKTAGYLPIRTDSKDWSVTAIRSTIASNSSSPTSSSSISIPAPTNVNNSLSNIFNGRRLRQRQEKNYSENPRRNSVNTQAPSTSCGISFSLPGSPNKNNTSEISISELQSSVNMYFGATNRIKNGEKFIIRGRRLCPDGRFQYLVEWDSMS